MDSVSWVFPIVSMIFKSCLEVVSEKKYELQRKLCESKNDVMVAADDFLKIINTIVKTHDKESIFSCDAFKMCSIDLTNHHNMLTELSDRY